VDFADSEFGRLDCFLANAAITGCSSRGTVIVRVDRVSATLGAAVSGVRLVQLYEKTWQEIQMAFLEHAVLVFPEQNMSRDEQVEFGLRLGDLELMDKYAGMRTGKRLETGKPMILEMANFDEFGNLLDRNDRHRRMLAGNEGWHSDSSFKAVASKASILSAIEVPISGGETEFADMSAAYDALSNVERNRLEGMLVWHSIRYSQATIGATDEEPADDPELMEGAWHPLISIHPDTGRRSLFIGRHACKVAGMTVAAGQSLLSELLEAACQPPRIFIQSWSPGDVVLWDNRCVLHRASGYPLDERRHLRHVRIAGDASNYYLNPDARPKSRADQ
jgi:alpha-ketoglutarate-dependent taurine dioxygenase